MDITEQVKEYMARKHDEGYEKRLKEAEENQREIAKHSQNQRSIEGLGRPVMNVDSRVYREWVAKEGKDIWKDKSFRKYMERNNPEMKAKSGGTGKTMVGYGS